jgi:hypothetical protein|nr:MAG TPA: hypothetical protein [Caudoviricetes sp.]
MNCVIELEPETVHSDRTFVIRSRKYPIFARVPIATDGLAGVLWSTIGAVENGNVFDLLLQNVKVYNADGQRITSAASKDGRYKIYR